MDGAGAALAEAAAEARPMQSKLVPENIEKWRVRVVDGDRYRQAVHAQLSCGHRNPLAAGSIAQQAASRRDAARPNVGTRDVDCGKSNDTWMLRLSTLAELGVILPGIRRTPGAKWLLMST
jgi:hypothetical protein